MLEKIKKAISRDRYNNTDSLLWDILQKTDNELTSIINPESFLAIRESIIRSGIDEVVDIGSGRTPTRGVLFCNPSTILCIDPCYSYYYKDENYDDSQIPEGVYGGNWGREIFEKNIRLIANRVKFPEIYCPDNTNTEIVVRTHYGNKVKFVLIPQDAQEWLNQRIEPLQFVILWHAFPIKWEFWAQLIDKLRLGGFILTTGPGILETMSSGKLDKIERPLTPNISIGSDAKVGSITGGVYINNNSLPLNIGLEPLISSDPPYLYRKIDDLPQEEILQILKNLK
jgi:hypothetical protein